MNPDPDVNSIEQKVIFSFQGAFGPPTWGHCVSMFLFANNVLDNYPNSDITMLFMPTGGSSNKKHLEPTQNIRLAVLKIFCDFLHLFTFQMPIFIINKIEISFHYITILT